MKRLKLEKVKNKVLPLSRTAGEKTYFSPLTQRKGKAS
jgi:hypothetical protein